MATLIPSAELADHIVNLLEKRQQHTDAIASIDRTLAGVGAALGGATAAPAKATADAPKGKRRRRRGSFTLSAEESILAFVKQNKNPTTQDVKKHFVDEGRGSTPDNALSKLVKEKKLKRVPLGKGIRGSRYVSL